MRRAAALVVLVSCGVVTGNGIPASEDRPLPEFTEVVNETGLDVRIGHGDGFSATVRVDANLMPFVRTSVRGEALVIDTTAIISPRVEGGVEVETVGLDAVTSTGSGALRVEGVSVPAFGIRSSGSGEVRALGGAGELTVTSSGSGAVRAFDLEAEYVTVTLTGSGDVEVHATRRLEITLTGSGDVLVRGDPPEVQVTDTGSGRVVR